MVRILANGDIVQDSDPRAQGRTGNASSNQRRPPMGHIHGDSSEPRQRNGQDPGPGGQMVQGSVFQTLNQRLLNLGVPRFNLGPYPIEPIVTVGFLLAGLLFGLPGLLFAAVLFGVAVMSNQIGGGGNDTGNRRPDRGDGDRSGHRLGRVLRHR